MVKKLGILLLLLAISAAASAGPSDSLLVTLNKHLLMPGDTLNIVAQYVSEPKKIATATLQMVIENDKGRSIKMRWPILKGITDGDLIIPDSLPQGRYKITFGVQQKFFRIYGMVKPPVRTTVLNTSLLTNKGMWLSADVPVETDGSFVIKNWLFEKDATLVFSRPKKVSSDLDITINSWLDSAYMPVAVAVQEFYVGNPPVALVIDSSGKTTTTDLTKFNDDVNLLPGVVVTATQKTKADKFNETYASGMFKSMDERVFDFMDDNNDAVGYTSVLDYLQGRVAGLQISRQPDGTSSANWRGSPVSFFIDEMRVEPEQISTVSTSDIAIVKVFPPPFFGGFSGSGGGIAIYTRRGEYSANTGNRHVFRIKGYSPLQAVLYFK